MDQDPEAISRLLLAGQSVPDAAFDLWLPEPHQRVSYRFWTSVEIALRVTRWFSAAGAERVLDVGSGIGKFCVVGALGSRMTFTGVEHRPHLVEAAEELAHRFGVWERVTFVSGQFDAVDFRDFEALYFFNPFGEHRFPMADHLDHTVEINGRRFAREVAEVERLLERMPVGTHIATYNGYGGHVPDSFELVHANFMSGIPLRLWRKARAKTSGGYWLELEESTVLHEACGRELAFLPTPEAGGAAEVVD